jgi:hypothetical protein
MVLPLVKSNVISKLSTTLRLYEQGELIVKPVIGSHIPPLPHGYVGPVKLSMQGVTVVLTLNTGLNPTFLLVSCICLTKSDGVGFLGSQAKLIFII